MDCVALSPELLPALTALVNRHIAQAPPGWTLSEAQVAAILASPTALWAPHYPEQTELAATETICTLDQGHLLAAAGWGYLAGQEALSRNRGAWLDWLVAEPEQAWATQLLLETIRAKSRAAGCRKLTTGRFAFGVGWLGVPTMWTHLVEGLQRAGFAVERRWIALTGTTDAPDMATPPSLAATQTVWQVNAAALEWELQLHTGDTLVGECEAWGVPRQFAECAGYAEWITIEYVGVEPPYRRQGLGRWLLAEQLRQQAQRGVTHAILWTGVDNHATRRLCESLGFRSGCECWEFRRDL